MNKMDREQILTELKKQLKNVNIRLPKDIGFSIENKTLCLKISEKGAMENMQENASAFEGWSLCIKANLSDLIDKVKIEVSDKDKLEKLGKGDGKLHYNRFKYRLYKFCKMYPKLEISHNLDLSDYPLDNLVLNFPKNDAKEVAEKKESKAQREYIVHNEKPYAVINQQLPVGVFKNNVNDKNAVMPGDSSAIDIWAIKDKDLYIFELKVKNKMVGIISELMFYVNIMKDVVKGRIEYPAKAKNCRLSGFEILYDKIMKKEIHNVKGIFLADELHPLINEKTLKLLKENEFIHKKVNEK